MKHIRKIAASCLLLCANLVHAQDFREVNWLELLPPTDRDALLSQPAVQHGADPSNDARPTLGGNLGAKAMSDQEVTAAWQSTNIVPEFNNLSVKIPGFVVPLEFDAAQNVTEFFLVPYFGACIHTPAPPPNQIIYVEVPGGFPLKSIYEPYYVQGTMAISMTHKEIGISAYSMIAEDVILYSK